MLWATPCNVNYDGQGWGHSAKRYASAKGVKGGTAFGTGSGGNIFGGKGLMRAWLPDSSSKGDGEGGGQGYRDTFSTCGKEGQKQWECKSR